VEDISWDGFLAPMKDAFQLPGFLTYWEMKRHWFDDDFQNFVQHELIEAKDTKQLYPSPNG